MIPIIFSMHSHEEKFLVYADKGYYGRYNRRFLSMNGIGDGIMLKGAGWCQADGF